MDLHISLVCYIFIKTPIYFSSYNFPHFTPPVLDVKGETVSLFWNMVVRILPHQQRAYILSMFIQDMLLVDERYLPFVPIEE